MLLNTDWSMKNISLSSTNTSKTNYMRDDYTIAHNTSVLCKEYTLHVKCAASVCYANNPLVSGSQIFFQGKSKLHCNPSYIH